MFIIILIYELYHSVDRQKTKVMIWHFLGLGIIIFYDIQQYVMNGNLLGILHVHLF